MKELYTFLRRPPGASATAEKIPPLKKQPAPKVVQKALIYDNARKKDVPVARDVFPSSLSAINSTPYDLIFLINAEPGDAKNAAHDERRKKHRIAPVLGNMQVSVSAATGLLGLAQITSGLSVHRS